MLIAAAVLLLGLGLFHSIAAELEVFRHLHRVSGFSPLGFPPILGSPDSPTRIIRACWHVLTIFGFAFAAIIGRCGTLPALGGGDRFALRTISVSLLLAAAIIFIGTRAKHVGWLVLLVAATLCWLGAR